MSISDKLLQLNTLKGEIKNAIEEKGVSVGTAPFTQYPAKIRQIEQGGGSIEYIYPLVKVPEEDWEATVKEDNVLYAII